MNGDLISRYALRKSVTDELERISCVYYKYNEYYSATKKAFNTVLEFIDNAPSVEPFERIGTICNENCGYKPQDKFVEMLNDRIEKSVCKYCQMNKHCELCEISRVFSIIALTNEEMKEGEKHDGSNQP